MERFSTCDLREKDVININDGACLGMPTDFEFDISSGTITAIIVGRPSGIFGWGKSNALIIPWKCIQCIGPDAILVRLSEGERLPVGQSGRRRFTV